MTKSSGPNNHISSISSAKYESRAGKVRSIILDQNLILVTLFLVMLGIVMVYSASISLVSAPIYYNDFNNLNNEKFYGTQIHVANYFLIKHCISIALAAISALCVLRISIDFWHKHAGKLFLIGLILLSLVFVPGIGKSVNGAWRWISLGVFNFQPSEFMKLVVLIYAADYTTRKQEYMHTISKGLLPLVAAVAIVGLLLLAEPDFGSFLVIAGIALGVLFLGGMSGKIFTQLAILNIAMFTTMVMLSPWRRERIFAYLDPWNSKYALGKAYQLTHSLIAFGRGSWFGVGLGGSVEKLNYLPEAHTDFILAVIGEELGFIFVATVICSFLWLTFRAFKIGKFAMQCERMFAGLVAQGIGIWLAWQAFINIGVAVGVLPTKGLTLPFISYGGSGIMINGILLGLLLRINLENHLLQQSAEHLK